VERGFPPCLGTWTVGEGVPARRVGGKERRIAGRLSLEWARHSGRNVGTTNFEAGDSELRIQSMKLLMRAIECPSLLDELLAMSEVGHRKKMPSAAIFAAPRRIQTLGSADFDGHLRVSSRRISAQ
jgi:hypothetical protein